MQTTGMQGSTPINTTGNIEGSAASGAGLSRLTDAAQQTMERLTESTAQATRRLKEQGEAFMQGPAVETARTYMREHPMATIGIAVAVGVLLSRLLSRR